MKKTQIASLLLAAVMTATSLPLTLSAADTGTSSITVPTVGENLLVGTETEANWSGELKAKNVHQDTHLRWQPYVSSYTSKLTFTNLTAPTSDTTYYVKMVLGSQADANSGAHGCRFLLGSTTLKVDFSNKKDQSYPNYSGDNTETFIIKVPIKTDATSFTIDVRGDNSYYNLVPKEIYSVDVYSDADCTTSIWSNGNIDDKFTVAGIGNNISWRDNNAATVLARDFMRVPAIALVDGDPAKTDYDSAAVYNPNDDITLTPGTYTLTFDARMSYYFRNSEHNAAEYEYEYQKALAAANTTNRTTVEPVKGVREYGNDDARTVITEDQLKNVVGTKGDDDKWSYQYKTDDGNKNSFDIAQDISTSVGNNDNAYAEKLDGDGALSTKIYHILWKRVYGFRNWMGNKAAYPDDSTKYAELGDRNPRSFFGFDSVKATYGDNNYRDIEVNFNNGTTDFVTQTAADVNDKWQTKTVTFTIKETTTLDSISFGGTGLAYDNDAFDLDNISLKLVTPYYEPANDAIETGALAADGVVRSASTTVNAVHDTTDYSTETKTYPKNGFISISRLPWSWRNADKGYASNKWYFQLKIDEKVVVDTDNPITYCVSVRIRNGVPNNAPQWLKMCLGLEGNNIEFKSQNEFTQYTVSYTPTAASDYLWVGLRSGVSAEDHPVDIDDITVWVDANTDGKLDANEEVLYSENYNDSKGTYIGTSSDYGKLYTVAASNLLGKLTIEQEFESNYERTATSDASVSYTNLALPSGIYTFNIDLRVPYHYHDNMRNMAREELEYVGDYGTHTWDTPEEGYETFAYNDHDAVVTFTLTPEEGGEDIIKTVTVDEAIRSDWSTLSTAINVSDGYKLTGVKVTPNFKAGASIPTDYQVLDFRNVYLTDPVSNKGTVTADDDDNYLNAASVTYENAIPSTIDNGYITVSERPAGSSATDNFLTLTINKAPIPETKYYISYDIVADKTMYLRQFVNFDTVAVNDKSVSTYIDAYGDSNVRMIPGNTVNKDRYWLLSELLADTEHTFVGQFTPASNTRASNIKITINRGDVSTRDNGALTIDNLKVWYESGDGIVYVYNNDFDPGLGLKGIEGNKYEGTEYTIEHLSPSVHTIYTPDSDNAMKLIYDLQLDGEAVVEGTYSFATAVKLTEETDKAATATVVFTLEDGTTKEKTFTLGTDWTDVYMNRSLEESPALVGITVVIDSDVPVMVTAPSLTIAPKTDSLHTGILMVLLKKKQLSIAKGPAAPDGYLYISERPQDSAKTANFLKLTIDEAPVVGREYFISYDIRTEGTMQIRQTVNFATKAVNDDSVNKYIDDVKDSKLEATKFTNIHNVSWLRADLAANRKYTFVGNFIPTETADNIQITINRGDVHTRDYVGITIDNLKVWYKSGDEIVYIYNNDFNSEEDALAGITGNQYAGVDYTIERVFP